MHRATLLHYIAANGVEGYRQKTPNNAVEVATMLLQAGAEVELLAEMYGGHHTTMSKLVSSGHPATTGVQVALVDALLDFGAAIDGCGSGEWTSPLMIALAFEYQSAAEALVRRGAREKIQHMIRPDELKKEEPLKWSTEADVSVEMRRSDNEVIWYSRRIREVCRS